MRISYSAFDTFNRCPLKYKLGYIDRVKVPQKPEFFFGGLIHEVVQMALKRDPIIPPLDELLAHYKRRWQSDSFPTKLEGEQYFKLGEDMIRKFHGSFKPGLRNIVATEKRFYVPLNDKHVLNGIIDRIDKLPIGGYEVIDYKTSKKLPTQDEVDKDKQLCIYNFAVGALWPDVQDVRLTLYFLKFDQKITTTRRVDEVKSIKDEIIATADKIENESKWEPKSNPLCDWCEYGEFCPLQKDKIRSQNPKLISQNEGIDTIVSDYIAAQETLKELEPKIHAHFDKENIEKFYHDKGNVTRLKNKKLSVSKN